MIVSPPVVNGFRWLLPVTIFVTFAALPEVISPELYFGGFSFQLYEPFLLATGVWALFQPAAASVVKYVAPFVVLCVAVTAWSLLVVGADLSKTGSDVRLPLYVALSMFIASKVVGTPHQARGLHALLVTIWVSAAAILMASASNIKLAGRSEAASLLQLHEAGAATRFLTPATFLAVVIVAVCLVCIISGNPRDFSVWVWLLPSALLLLTSFSRNHLLGLGAAVVFGLLAFRSARSIVAAVRVAAVVGVVAALLQFGAANILAPLPGASFIATQSHSYVERVVDGLKPEILQIDPSVKFRQEETATIMRAIPESPVIGHGFGYRYKSPTGPPGSFDRESAPYYAHNFYLWFLLKAGAIGLVLFAWMALVPVLRVLFRPTSTMQVATASAGVGLLAISTVAPIPNDASGAPLLGAVLGTVVVLTHLKSQRTTQRTAEENVGQQVSASRETVPASQGQMS